MNLQLHISTESFSVKAQKIVTDLEWLEENATRMVESGSWHQHELLKNELKRITTDLSYLRLDCLRSSIMAGYQNQSAEIFQALDLLNKLVDWLQDFTFVKERPTPSVSMKTVEDIMSLQNAVAATRIQLNKISKFPRQQQ